MPQPENQGGDHLIGRVIDNRFRVLELIGSGGMGSVYLAEHVGIGKRVAIKLLRADLRGRPELVHRFRREAMAVSKLSDAHTITVFDFGVWKGLVYLVMEHLQGMDLSAMLAQEHRLSPARVAHLAHQILSSLAEAHAVGVVHRDLKPENIFLTRATNGDELVKVLDFGLAKVLSEHQEGSFTTQDGALLGTPYYMSPEQIRGERVDPRADLYALGALLFHMSTGRPPFEGRTPMQVLEGHLTGLVPTFAELGVVEPGAEAIEAITTSLLARDRDERPATALAVDDALLATIGLGDAPGRLTGSSTPAAAKVVEQSTGPVAVAAPARFTTSSILIEPPPESAAITLVGQDADRYGRRLRLRRLVTGLGLLGALAVAAYLAWDAVEHGADTPQGLSAEVEPNDDSTSANQLQDAVEIRGHLGRRANRAHSDRDVFVAQVPPTARTVSVTLTAVPNLDLVVEGVNRNGARLFKLNAAAEGVGEAAEGLPIAKERMWFVVREVWVDGRAPGENSTDAYGLTVRFEGPSDAGTEDARVPDASEKKPAAKSPAAKRGRGAKPKRTTHRKRTGR